MLTNSRSLLLLAALALLLAVPMSDDGFISKVGATLTGGAILAVLAWLYAELRPQRFRLPLEVCILGFGSSFDEATEKPITTFGLGSQAICMNVLIREGNDFEWVVCALTDDGRDIKEYNALLIGIEAERNKKLVDAEFEQMGFNRGQLNFKKKHTVASGQSLFLRLTLDVKRECDLDIEFEAITAKKLAVKKRKRVRFRYSSANSSVGHT